MFKDFFSSLFSWFQPEIKIKTSDEILAEMRAGLEADARAIKSDWETVLGKDFNNLYDKSKNE